MSESSDEEGPGYLPRKHVELLLRMTKELLSQALNAENPAEPVVEAAIEAGFLSTSVLKKIWKKLSLSEGEIMSADDIDDLLEDFVYRFQIFAHQTNTFRNHRKNLIDFQLTMSELIKEVKKMEKLVEQTSKSQLGKRIRESCTEEDIIAASPIRKKIKFIKVTPKTELVPAFRCHLCPKKYGWLKSLSRHLKETHDGAKPAEELTEVKDLITCKMCLTKQRRDSIARHLLETHKIQKEGSKGVFRGFLTFDNLSWQPLWLEKGDEDPPSELLIPVVEGHVVVYGVRFQVEEDSYDSEEPVAEENIESDNVTLTDKLEEGRETRLNAQPCQVSNLVEKSLERINEEEFVLQHMDPFGTPVYKEKAKESGGSSVARRLDWGEVEDEILRDKEDSLVLDKEVSNYEDEAGARSKVLNESQIENLGFDQEESKSEEGAASKVVNDGHIENLGVDQEDSKSEEGIIPKQSHDVPRIKVQTFTVNVCEGELWFVDPDDVLVDSDYEEGDDKEDSDFRMEMKKLRLQFEHIFSKFLVIYFRWKRRDNVETVQKLSEIEANAIFISEFENFLKALKFETHTNDSNLSTIRKNLGHLFYYEDSMLSFQSKHIEDYNLSRHINPLAKDFLQVSDPTMVGGWIQAIGGATGKEEPGRRKEMLKSHARLRQFILEKIEKLNLGSTADAYYQKEMVVKHINKISQKISSNKIFSGLTKLEDQKRTQKLKARQMIYPSQTYNEQNAAKRWFKSKEAKSEEEFCQKVHAKCMSGSKIGRREFDRVARYTRFSLALEDKSRRSVYDFKNTDFATKIDKWLPGPVDPEDSSSEVDMFDSLPEGWNPDVPPQPGMEATCWIIQVCGDQEGLKGGRPAEIVLTQRSLELCLMYKDLKLEMLKEISGHDFFFVNMLGHPLGPLQRTAGSLLEKLGLVCELSNPTQNTFRRAAEMVVQASPSMKHSVEKIQQHSNRVGLTYYDRSGQNKRAQFISQLAAVESPQKVKMVIPERVLEKRVANEKNEREKAIEDAKAVLARDKMIKKERLNRKFDVDPEDLEFLQICYSRTEDTMSADALSFPDDTAWKKIFYRNIDAQSGQEGVRMKKIEEQMFSKVKPSIEKELGEWKGKKLQNQLADLKISVCVKTSFKKYEEKKLKGKSYFKF